MIKTAENSKDVNSANCPIWSGSTLKKKKKPFHGQQELAWTMDRAEVACGKWL